MTAPLTADRFREIQALEPADRTPQEIGTATLDLVREIHRLRHCVKTADRGHRAALAGTCTMLGIPVDTAEPDVFEAIRRMRAELEQARADRERLLAFANWTARNTYPLTEVHAAALTAIDSPSTRAALVDLAQVAAETAAADDDEWVRCSLPHCPNAERYQYAQQRGWTPQHMGTWHCTEHSPACTCGARPVHQTGCDTDQDN